MTLCMLEMRKSLYFYMPITLDVPCVMAEARS